MNVILLVDDEVKLLRILRSSLEKKGYKVLTAASGLEARKKIREEKIDIIFLDLMLPDTTGLELLQEHVPLYPHKVFVMMTAFGNVENAVSAIKAGAFDYIVKPAKLEEILIVIKKACEWLEMKEENKLLKERVETLENHNKKPIGTSTAMKRIFELVERVAETDATVLIEGESGTGKSMVAQVIHTSSQRSQAPFIPINCAAIPEQLLESELFGYEKGAFTGATEKRIGKFEAAHRGTIFLDEIGELSSTLQAKLLQITQEKTFMRLGSNKVVHVDVRIITATNRNLKKMVEEGLFREDLYYRLNIIDMYLPPLRERKDDIRVLIEEFINRYRKLNKKDYQISDELLQILMKYHWPGNVRELENAIERAVVLCRGNKLSIEDFPREICNMYSDMESITKFHLTTDKPLPETLEDVEKQIIIQALEDSQGQAATAARKLGISRQGLLYKMNKYFIS
jgi:DNA-binding NtrC family response regulator